jgi:acyl carrier protein
MIPVSWTLLPALPANANGKRDRAALPDPDGGTSAAEYVAPKTDTERAIIRIWAEALGRDLISAADNFFAIGGHSLLATRIVSHIRQQLGVTLPLAAVFAQPTVAALAQEVDALRADQALCPDGTRHT